MPDTASSDARAPEDEVTEASVTSRASGRPPEEVDSDDPQRQARVILEESEGRTAERSDASAAD
jgi:hypothetical protein